jgi:hypothetical protein
VHKKIFLTLDEKNKRACLKLSAIEQNVFADIDKNIIFPVPNKWGKQGWTFVELEHIERKLFKAILTSAYCHVAPKKLADKFRE